MRHPRGLYIPVLRLLCAATLASPLAAHAATRTPVQSPTTVAARPPIHPSVAWPRRDVARAAIGEQRRRLAAHRQHWPRFLTDVHRSARLESRGLLTARTARAARAARARREKAGAARIAAVDSASVLLVRCGFAANREPSLTSMDASGDFRLTPDSTIVVDPPPHDANYFDAQILALQAYYDVVSHGTLHVRGQVFPPQGEPSIKLSDIADYGPGAGGFWTLELLENYFRAAIQLTDSTTAGRLLLSDFDSIVLVHPGSDLQNDINRDSPNDLPTFFVTLADSIPVQGGTHEIRNGLVMPEGLTQDGLVGGILGGFVHEFGHQLGLPDWYDTHFGLPTVGEWDLMDSGNAAFFAFQVAGTDEVEVAYGLLPTGLSAMSRYLLGWEDPYVMRAPEDAVTLRPSLSNDGTGPRVARLDVAADEYFLVENRRDRLAAEDVDPCVYLNRDAATGVILWPSRDDAVKPSRERHNSGEYDYFISAPSAPIEVDCNGLGFGLLVWHVDERILAEGYPYNAVNVDERQRSLRLLEASGDFEIGDWRLFSDGFLGDGWNDPFREDYATQLRADTRPNNLNNDWAPTGWEITDVRFAAPESHTLSVRVVDGIAGWPRTLRAAPDTLPPLIPKSAVYAPLGSAAPALILADSLGIWAHDATGGRRIHRGALRPESLAYQARWAAIDTVGTLAALDASRLWVWDARLVGDSLAVRPGFPVTLPGGAGNRVVLLDADAGALVETAVGDWARIDPNGTVVVVFEADPGLHEADPVVASDLTGGPGAAFTGRNRVYFLPLPSSTGAASQWNHGLDAPDSLLSTAAGRIDVAVANSQVVVLRRDGALRVVDPERGVLGGFQDLPSDDWLGLALGDVNGDGELDIVAVSPTRIAVETSRGAMLLGTPLRLRDVFAVQNPLTITTEPLVADVAGDSLPELLVGTDLGLVYALDAAGKPVPGWPRKLLPDLFPSALIVADVDGVGSDYEILAVSQVSAAALTAAGGSTRPGWTATGGGSSHRRYAVAGAPLQARDRLVRAERPLLAYPNPARDGLVQLRITAQESGPFALSIYNLEGQRVWEQNGTLRAGTQEIAWNCSGMASGVYLCRFVSAAAGVPSPRVEPITLLR